MTQAVGLGFYISRRWRLKLFVQSPSKLLKLFRQGLSLRNREITALKCGVNENFKLTHYHICR
ncbi:MAG TPA: hypothetical protein VGJ55_17395, partial [Pyrinomonadaceae bacterium]